MHIQDPEQRRWIQERVEHKYPAARPRRAAAHPQAAQRRRGVRDLPADQVRRPEAVLARGRRVRHPAARRDPARRRRRRPRRGRHRHGPPRPAQRARQHRRQDLRPDLPRVRGQHRPAHGPGLRRREVPPRRRGHVHSDDGAKTQVTWPPTRPTSRPVDPVLEGIVRAKQDRHRQGRGGLHRPAAAAARRRRLRRPGRRRRDPEPVPAARLPHRRHRSTSSSTTRSASPPRRRHRRSSSTAPTSPG